MNEEALNAAYLHFKEKMQPGYNGSIEDFKTLMSTDSGVFDASLSNFQSGGYNGGAEDFSKLMGVESGKTQGAAEVDATAVPQIVPTGTESASENGSLGLPKVSPKIMMAEEGEAIAKLKTRFAGLGFTFEQARVGGDAITITSPKDANGNAASETFEFDYGVLGFDVFGKADSESQRLNEFIKLHANDSPSVNAGAYANAWKFTNEAETDYLFEGDDIPEDKKGQRKLPSELTAKELESHTEFLLGKLNANTRNSYEVKEIEDGIIADMANFQKDLVASLKNKYATEIAEAEKDLTSEKSSALLDLVNSEYNEAVNAEFNTRRAESSELLNLFDANRLAVQSRYGDMLQRISREEGFDAVLGETAMGRIARDFPIFNSVARGIYGTGAFKLPKSWNEADALKLSRMLETASSELKNLEKRDSSEKFVFSGDANTEFAGEDNLSFRYAPNTPAIKKARKERAELDRDDPMWLPMEAVTSGTYKTGYWTVGERIEVLKRRQTYLREKAVQRMVTADEYQQKIDKLITPEIFGESITNPSLSLRDYGLIFGDQLVQMAGAVLSGGGSTFMQEAGSAFTEITTIKAMDKLFPIGSEIDMGITTSTIKNKEDQQRHFYALPKSERFEAVLDIVENGEGDLDTATRTGVANAGLDLVSNAIVIGKATKFLPKDLARKLFTKKYKEFLSGAWKTMGKDVTIASFSEFLTETAQEGVSIMGVGSATGDYGTTEGNVKRILEAGGQALIVTGPMVGGGQITTTTVNEIKNTVSALRDPESTRAYVNKMKSTFDAQLQAGEITQDQRDTYFTELEAAEQVINDTKLKDLKGEQKKKAIDNVVISNKLKEENTQIEESIKKVKKEIGEEAYSEFTTNDEIKLERNKKKIKELETENIKEVLKNDYLTNGKDLADWVNNQKEGDFKNKEVITFKTAKEAEAYIEGKGIKMPEQQKQRLLNGDVNGANLGDLAIIIDENVSNNIDKEDWSSSNVVHHEVLHFILEGFDAKELDAFIDGTIKAIKASNDPKMKAVEEKLNEKLLVYELGGVGLDTKAGKEEFFTSLSDALNFIKVSDINLENGGVLADIGEMLQNVLSRNTKAGIDFSNLDAENTLKFIQKYNEFNGKGPKFKASRIIGGKEVDDREDQVKESVSVGKRSSLIESLNSMQQGAETKSDFQKPNIFNKVFESTMPGGAISNYIRSLQMSPEKTQATIDSVTDRLINFDPQATRKDGTTVGKEGLGEFLMANVGFAKLDAAKKLAKEGEIRKVTQRIDAKDESGRTIAETIADTTEDAKPDTKRVKKARKIKSLEDITLDNKDVISGNIEKKINDLIEENPENLIEQLEGLISKDFAKEVKSQMGKIQKKGKETVVSPEYKAHHAFNYDTYIAALDVNTIKANYNQLFDIKQIGREKDKKVDPTTGKVTYPGKGIYDISTTKAKWTKYFTEGGYTTLLARQKKLAEFISKDIARTAINKQIAENSNNLNEVILAELREWDAALDKQKGETISFDSIKFSATVRGFNPVEIKDFYQNLPLLSISLQKTNLNDKDAVIEAVKNIYDDSYASGKLKKLGEDIFKVVNRYGGIEERHTKLKKKPQETLNEYLFNNLKAAELDLTLAEILDLIDEKGRTLQLSKSFDKKDVINKARAEIVTVGKKWLKKYGKEKALMMLIHASGMYSTSTKIGRGNLFEVNNNGVVTELDILKDMSNKELLELAETMKDPEYLRPVQRIATEMEMAGDQNAWRNDLIRAIRKQRVTTRTKSTGSQRYQAFNGKEDYNTWVIKEIFGDEVKLTDKGRLKGTQELTINDEKVKIDTSLFSQTSDKAVADRDYDGREKESAISELVVREIAQHYKDQIKAKKLDKEDFAVMMMSMASNMQSPLKRAANLGYIFKNKEGQKYTGKLRYEHMIPTNYMVVQLTNAYMNDGNVDLDALFKEYTVAVIPDTMDKIFDEVNLTQVMPIGYKIGNSSTRRYYNMSTYGHPDLYAIESLNPKDKGKVYGEAVANMKFKESVSVGNKALAKAVQASRAIKEPKGITVLDFDDTLATTKSQVLYTMPDATTGKLNAEEFAKRGNDLLAEGAVFDFSEFNQVVKGKTAPLFQKALKLKNKFGTKNMFILTARAPESATAIKQFLDAQGLNIPLDNITGLGKSEAEAKATWIAEKVGEGYNDFYFADDAIQNVTAVKNMLEQFDVKSKVQQARVKFSESMDGDFNKILEDVLGIDANKRFSSMKGRKRGESKGKFRFFIPPSHEDFVGLLYNFMGVGRKGDAHRDFLEQALIRPLNRANRELDTAKQSIANDFKSLNKSFPDIKKKLKKKTPQGDFTHEDAIRVYLWDINGHDIPGLAKTDQEALVNFIESNPDLQSYASALNIISKQDAYVSPTDGWESGDIRVDLNDATGRVGREEYFAEFLQNTDIIFSKENLNKIEAGYGKGVREALEDMLYRIKTGRNRPSGNNALVNRFVNYINGAVGSVMFLNIRSAVLQQMSIVNYINFADNNIFSAAKAFANQKQYWSDWAYIFNSDMLKQRRGGIQTDVNGSELAETISKSKFPMRTLVRELLKLGFTPTQIGDNIAIATGGSTYYRNRIKTYLKQGLSKTEAEAKAWTDFQDITQSTQQSARPDMVSQQQASPLGKFILAFQNVTSQFNRLGKKAFLDIKNRRITKPNTSQFQSDVSNASRIMYYFAVQNMIFYGLQTALFAAMFDDNEDDEKFLKKKERMINGSIDSVLRGTGAMGAVVATMKNMVIKFADQRDKKAFSKDESAVLMEMLNVSPPLGIKARKIVNAEKTLNYNKKAMEEMETFDIDNPQWSATTNYIEGVTNVPLNRLYNKTQNMREALNNQHSAWQRALMFMGWSKYNLGLYEDDKSSTPAKKDDKEDNKDDSSIPRIKI